MFEKTTLPNGLRVVTATHKDTKTATVLVLVGTGSKYEEKRVNGVSHFLEHMFFKGTKTRPTAAKVAEPMDRVGGMFNAFTGEEYTGYFAKVDFTHLGLAFEWVADIFFHSLLSKEEIQKEKGVVIEELHMYQDVPMSRVQVLWHELLYGDQPAGWNIVGTKESISGLARHDLVSYVRNQYIAPHVVVSVAGNLEVSEVIRKVKRLFGNMRTSGFQEKQKVVESQEKPQARLEWRDTDQTHIALGVRAYNLFHPRRYAQALLATLLGGMKTSRLFIQVREKLGLAYYIETSLESDTDSGYVMTRAGVKNEGVEKAIKAIMLEYQKVAQKKISLSELQKAKDHIKGKMALELEPSDEKAFFYGLQELLEKNILTPEQIYDKIDQVRAQDIRNVARDIFRPENLNLVALGPFKDKSRFEKLLQT